MSELGAGSGTSYPASLDVDNTVEVDASTKVRADVPNDLAAAIIAVQTELGTDPAGSMTDVKTFLQTEHSADGTHSDLTVDNITISGELIQKVGSDVSSASDLDITPAGNFFDVTGTTTIATMKSKGVGTQVTLQFDGACQLTHDATNFDLPGGANITTAAGDQFTFYEYASADWRCIGYALASGRSVINSSSSATTSAAGLVEIATQAEVTTGTDTTRSLTPETFTGAAATQAEQETGSSIVKFVTPGTQKFHQSAAKTWANFNAAGTLAASYNVASITDTATGRWSVNHATDFSSANYCMSGSAGDTSVSHPTVSIDELNATITAGVTPVIGSNGANGTVDLTLIHCSFFGDQ